MRKIAAITAAALLITTQASAGIYKCTIDGETIFSQQPCSANAEEITVKTHEPSADEIEQAAERRSRLEENNTTSASDRKRREAEIKIKNAEKRIATYQKKMESELAALAKKKEAANNNLAGATYEQSISTEMEAASKKWTAKIDAEQVKIERLRDQ